MGNDPRWRQYDEMLLFDRVLCRWLVGPGSVLKFAYVQREATSLAGCTWMVWSGLQDLEKHGRVDV